MAIGIPNYDQAGRILQFNLDKAVKGNVYIEFNTSVKAFGVRPGDIITVTYLKEGFNRQPFRVLKISPATNYRTSSILAQIHDDAWYADTNGQSTSPTGPGQGTGAGIGTPRPLMGSVIDANGNPEFGVVESDTTASDGSIEVDVSLSFVPPATLAATGPGTPLVDIAPQLSTGGTLTAGETLYYAVSGVDSAGGEGPLSFIVRASVIADGSSVSLSGLSFASGTATFNVYRGATPSNLYLIATNQTLGAQFTDTGLAIQPIAPPDPFFDHANFYWRMEQLPETAATIHSASTIGNSTLQMDVNSYRGMTLRITRGAGAGQEAAILSNTATTLTVSPAWVFAPDASSYFTVAESAWHFGAVANSSPVQFEIPNMGGDVVQLTGRSANANDVESPAGSGDRDALADWRFGRRRYRRSGRARVCLESGK